MKQSAIKKIQDLHNRVVHLKTSDESEYLKEDKIIKNLNDSMVNLVCAQCFPLREEMPRYPDRPAYKYDIRYPKIQKMVGYQID